jgi:FkbM family methyltransferase
MLRQIIQRTKAADALSLLRSAKLYYATHTYTPKVVHRTYGRNSFYVHIKDHNAEQWYDYDWTNRSEIAFLEQFALKPGATVFNLGAHQGVVALMLAAIVGREGKVVALEAGPYNAEVAELNREANDATNLYILNAAIAAERGSLRFADSLCGHVDDGLGGIEVPARTIDDLADEFGHPSLLYIDVEGFECEALSGAARTLALGSDCFVEIHSGVGLEKYGGSIDKALSFFPADRYDLFYATCNGGDFVPLTDRKKIAGQMQGKRWFIVATLKR